MRLKSRTAEKKLNILTSVQIVQLKELIKSYLEYVRTLH